VRSANAKRCATIASSLLLLSGLCGCVQTTEQKNARARLRAERVLAGQGSVHVTHRNPNVKVADVTLLHGNSATAIAVMLRNDAATPTSDLPISVGIRTPGGHAVLLNQKPELPYFQTHVGAIAGGARVTWVFSSPTSVASSARPFATVGNSTLPISAGVEQLPLLTTSAASARGRLLVNATISNRSDVPQYGLAAYAYALSGNRFLAAGYAPVADLESGSTATVAMRLIGDPHGADVHIDAPPTILQ